MSFWVLGCSSWPTPLVPLASGFVGMFGLPRWFLKHMTKRRQKKFLNEFANAIDVIVRGHLRYDGTDATLPVSLPPPPKIMSLPAPP